MNVGGIIHGYTVTGVANGYVIGRSDTKPNPYVVWKIDHNSNGVCCGHYFNDCEEAEWDFCARAFEWFEDNVNIHIIEDGNETLAETRSVFEPPKETDKCYALDAIFAARAAIAEAAGYVEGMCREIELLKAERGYLNGNNSDD